MLSRLQSSSWGQTGIYLWLSLIQLHAVLASSDHAPS